jgi:hypothetical protein
MRRGGWARGAILSTVMCVALTGLDGCHKSGADASPAADAKSAAPGSVAAEGAVADKTPAEHTELREVTLTPEQIEKIGLEVAAAKATQFNDEALGYGNVVPHDAIAQAQAELISAQATAKQSQAALDRARRLAGTAGALSADTEEVSARQAQVDAAALTLARQRLSATFGLKPPWNDGGDLRVLRGLANGSPKLVRITFPLGTLPADLPKSLQAARIGAVSGKRWKMTAIWGAPAEANVPGRSLFAILHGADVGEGERILVWAPIGTTEAGVVIPQAAVVINDGKYWCYLEQKPGTYVRTQIDAHRLVEDGYFLSEGVKAGDKVVMQGAAQLLAQESNSGGEAD